MERYSHTYCNHGNLVLSTKGDDASTGDDLAFASAAIHYGFTVWREIWYR